MPAEASAALHLDRVNVFYGNAQAVHDFNLTVSSGDTFGLIGLNGAGKTTLIKSILGLHDHAGGEGAENGGIRIFGGASADMETRRQFAFLPERFDPPWFLKGYEFLNFSMSLYGRRETQENIIAWAERLALDPAALKRKVQTYSKGMRQKLGIIATLLTGCRLLILDEPMSGLDPMARVRVKDALLEAKRQGRTIFLSSHILSDMDEICDRVAVINRGRLLFTGTPSALKQEARNENLERAFLNLVEADGTAYNDAAE
jgi:ABC-2 type transport system ATP-binding protein